MIDFYSLTLLMGKQKPDHRQADCLPLTKLTAFPCCFLSFSMSSWCKYLGTFIIHSWSIHADCSLCFQPHLTALSGTSLTILVDSISTSEENCD